MGDAEHWHVWARWPLNDGRRFESDEAKAFNAVSQTLNSGDEAVCEMTANPYIWETLCLTKKGSLRS